MAELMTGYEEPFEAGGVAGKAPALRRQAAFKEGIDNLQASFFWDQRKLCPGPKEDVAPGSGPPEPSCNTGRVPTPTSPGQPTSWLFSLLTGTQH